MTAVFFLLTVTAAGLGGYALLVWLGLDDLEAWAGGRVAGLVVIAMPAWWAGVAGLSHWRVVGAAVLVPLTIAGAIVAWRRANWRQIAIAEAVFLVVTAAVIVIRLDHPQIAFTEKPMDLGILASLLRTESFPPPDMWLAGETLPYYYWGALLWTVPLAVSGLPLEIGYNLIVGLIGGMVGVLLWMLGRRAGGSHFGGLLVTFFGLLAGTPDGMRQLVAGARLDGLDYWHSSRQIVHTITEWPLFTVWLGDLHPHLLVMPVVCLALLVAWQAGRRRPSVAQTVFLAVLFGVAWSANPWSMPPTLAGIALLLFAGGDGWRWPVGEGRRSWLAVIAIGIGGWLATAPFQLGFRPFFQGIRPVFAWTEPAALLAYAGCLLVPTAVACVALLRRLIKGDVDVVRAVMILVGAATVVMAAALGRPTLVLLAVMLVVLVAAALTRATGVDRPAIALAALGVFLFLIPEIVYVADGYGDDLHRMNTVFKSYIQAWMLLAVALPVTLRLGFANRALRWGIVSVMVILALPHPVGMAVQQFKATKRGLDGMAWMTAGDRAIVAALREEPPGTVLAEAVGGAYTEYARLSAASGVPAYLGWANHESVWRGNEILTETEKRKKLLHDLYTADDPDEARRLAESAGIHVVAVGSLERKDFSQRQLKSVLAAGEPIVEEGDSVLIRLSSPGNQ
jgi:YYY domain-containing protein